jgi:polysaccharide export outer membrane protein
MTEEPASDEECFGSRSNLYGFVWVSLSKLVNSGYSSNLPIAIRGERKIMTMIRNALFLIAGLMTLPISTLWGQARPVVDTVVAAPNATASLPDHPIAPNDLLSITIFDEPELSKTAVRVGTDGTVVMPALSNALKVQGLLPREVEVEVKRELVDEQILVHPLVSVLILDYATRVVSVVGDVKTPGQYTMTGPLTLYEALAKAGWTTVEAGSDVLLTTSPSEPPRRINLMQLQMGKDSSLNVSLTGGEVVNVPDAPKVWVTGNVTKPQAVPIKTPADASVIKVVASAEGLTQYYNKTAYIYRADSATGNRKEIVVPLWAIMHRKADDIPLASDDILLIPDDNGTKRREFLQILQTMAGAGASAGVLVGIQKY